MATHAAAAADAIEPHIAVTIAAPSRVQSPPSTPQPAVVTEAATPRTPVSPVPRGESAAIDEIVPPSDASTSSPLSSPPAHSRNSTTPVASPRTHALDTPASPLRTSTVSPPPAASAVTEAVPASDHLRLKVVIPPVPPFLHEIDKRNERERVRRMQCAGSVAPLVNANSSVHDDDDAAFHTPEKPSKRKMRASDGEALLAFDESEYRMSQITPPPSERMLDHKNPPLPPRKAKKRRRLERPVNPVTGRMRFSALPLPRLSLSSETSSTTDFSQSSPPRLDTPPGSPVPMASVFRSLADEFAAVQDTPPLRTLRAPPRITRAARQCTPPISSRTRSAIQTPTTTMVLRSRQLNPSKSS